MSRDDVIWGLMFGIVGGVMLLALILRGAHS